MKERVIFLYIISLAAAALCFVQAGAAAGIFSGRGALVILSVAVLFSASLLFAFLRLPSYAGQALVAVGCAVMVWYAPGSAVPLLLVTVVAIGCEYLGFKALTAATAAACVVCAFLLRPQAPFFVLSVMMAGLSVYIIHLLAKREEADRALNRRNDRIAEMRAAIKGQGRAAKSVEQISKLEERNRLAARIHDEIGHGMSGSILLLEGVDFIIEKDFETARETVRRVTENLRESTEKIRKMLREERSEGADVSLAKIENELAVFEMNQPVVKTALAAEGDMDAVSRTIWTCIYENMIEAMTNTLKHSDSTLFRVSIINSNKLLRVEFADNGSPAGGADTGGTATGGAGAADFWDRRGIGLQNMEERCALCYGRCFFRSGRDGFHVVMTFPLRPAESQNS